MKYEFLPTGVMRDTYNSQQYNICTKRVNFAAGSETFRKILLRLLEMRKKKGSEMRNSIVFSKMIGQMFGHKSIF